jgi:hypothetical protein
MRAVVLWGLLASLLTVIVALMAGHEPEAQVRFDGLARYALAHPSRIDQRLPAWAQNRRCRDVKRAVSATDGDLDIAYGLLLAHRQWGSKGAIDYLGVARRTLAGILAEDIHADMHLTTLGDWTRPDRPWYWNGSRHSDWMLGHFSVFAAATTDPRWTVVRAAHLRQIRRLPSRTGLLPDFVRTQPRVRPAGAVPRDGARRELLVERLSYALADRHGRRGERRPRLPCSGYADEPLGAAPDGRRTGAYPGRRRRAVSALVVGERLAPAA